MKKFFSLIRASMTEGMSLFKVNIKKQSSLGKIMIPILLTLFIMGTFYSYAEIFIEQLKMVNMEFVILTLFIVATTILTLFEGIYKSGSLLFNCKDDNLLLSLPIKKSTVLFIRVFKFYLFEVMYNSLFLFPAMLAYAVHVMPGITYYVVSFLALLIFPIIPILISCLIGTIITFISAKFRGRNKIQTLITGLFIIGVMYFSYNQESFLNDIAKKASNINDFITKIYYPAGAYIDLITKFNYIKLIEFIGIHLGLFAITIMLIGRIYFNVNSSIKSVKVKKLNKKYIIKSATPTKALMKKEFSRFINSTVYIVNSCAGLVIFVASCVAIAVKFDGVLEPLFKGDTAVVLGYVKGYMPVLLLGFICGISFITTITSSMISLEGKAFNILKSLPISPYKIIKAKILTAVSIMLPFILIGDIVVFIRFKFNILSMLIILFSSILIPLVAETIGIIINLKYPKLDAKNDTEVVKQSMSVLISLFLGMGMAILTIYLMYKIIEIGTSCNMTMLIVLAIYTVIYFVLDLILKKISDKSFENISV